MKTRKFLTVMLVIAVMFTFSFGSAMAMSVDEATAQALASAKESAIKSLTSLVNISDYNEDGQKEVKAIIEEGTTLINLMTDLADITDALSDYQKQLFEVENADKVAVEKAKEKALELVEEYRDLLLKTGAYCGLEYDKDIKELQSNDDGTLTAGKGLMLCDDDTANNPTKHADFAVGTDPTGNKDFQCYELFKAAADYLDDGDKDGMISQQGTVLGVELMLQQAFNEIERVKMAYPTDAQEIAMLAKNKTVVINALKGMAKNDNGKDLDPATKGDATTDPTEPDPENLVLRYTAHIYSAGTPFEVVNLIKLADVKKNMTSDQIADYNDKIAEVVEKVKAAEDNETLMKIVARESHEILHLLTATEEEAAKDAVIDKIKEWAKTLDCEDKYYPNVVAFLEQVKSEDWTSPTDIALVAEDANAATPKKEGTLADGTTNIAKAIADLKKMSKVNSVASDIEEALVGSSGDYKWKDVIYLVETLAHATGYTTEQIAPAERAIDAASTKVDAYKIAFEYADGWAKEAAKDDDYKDTVKVIKAELNSMLQAATDETKVVKFTYDSDANGKTAFGPKNATTVGAVELNGAPATAIKELVPELQALLDDPDIWTYITVTDKLNPDTSIAAPTYTRPAPYTVASGIAPLVMDPATTTERVEGLEEAQARLQFSKASLYFNAIRNVLVNAAATDNAINSDDLLDAVRGTDGDYDATNEPNGTMKATVPATWADDKTAYRLKMAVRELDTAGTATDKYFGKDEEVKDFNYLSYKAAIDGAYEIKAAVEATNAYGVAYYDYLASKVDAANGQQSAFLEALAIIDALPDPEEVTLNDKQAVKDAWNKIIDDSNRFTETYFEKLMKLADIDDAGAQTDTTKAEQYLLAGEVEAIEKLAKDYVLVGGSIADTVLKQLQGYYVTGVTTAALDPADGSTQFKMSDLKFVAPTEEPFVTGTFILGAGSGIASGVFNTILVEDDGSTLTKIANDFNTAVSALPNTAITTLQEALDVYETVALKVISSVKYVPDYTEAQKAAVTKAYEDGLKALKAAANSGCGATCGLSTAYKGLKVGEISVDTGLGTEVFSGSAPLAGLPLYSTYNTLDTTGILYADNVLYVLLDALQNLELDDSDLGDLIQDAKDFLNKVYDKADYSADQLAKIAELIATVDNADEDIDLASLTIAARKGIAAANENEVTVTPEYTDVQAKAYVQDLAIKATSKKLAAKKIKITIKADVKELTDHNYTVEYKFYRSTKKGSGYGSPKATKTTNTYTNSSGLKSGKTYYYKAKLVVKNPQGEVVATTPLTQCDFAYRTIK